MSLWGALDSRAGPGDGEGVSLAAHPSSARPPEPASLEGRRFLIASAPYGPFSRALARSLESRGGHVERLILNTGDLWDWRRPGGQRHHGSLEAFRRGLAAALEPFTDVIVWGDTSAHARAVLAEARALGLGIWLLENGYFRPDWITLERQGVNAESAVPRDPRAFATVVAVEPKPAPVGRILPWHVLHISRYYLLELLGRPVFPHFRPEYDPSPWRQALGHVGRAARIRRHPARRRVRRLLDERTPFILVCLQRDGDSQLVRHSEFRDNRSFLGAVLDSFADHAPEGLHLVVKGHPLDAGVIDLERMTRDLARARGVGDRVHPLDGGSLAELCRASCGLVVNNSSAALSALGFGTPVKVLGRAFFDMPGLTDPGSLHAFWHHQTPPDPDLFDRFRTWVIENTQINGGFHGPAVRRPTADAIARAMAAASRPAD